MIVALVFHVLARVWSFAYFIPRALRFEKSGNLSKEQSLAARRWTRLSRWRPMLAAASIVALCLLVLHVNASVVSR
jgi:anti-sigma-K factor RskA